jgi:hypothetical protein
LSGRNGSCAVYDAPQQNRQVESQNNKHKKRMHKKCAFFRNLLQELLNHAPKGLTIGWKLAEADAELATIGLKPSAAGHDGCLLVTTALNRPADVSMPRAAQL